MIAAYFEKLLRNDSLNTQGQSRFVKYQDQFASLQSEPRIGAVLRLNSQISSVGIFYKNLTLW